MKQRKYSEITQRAEINRRYEKHIKLKNEFCEHLRTTKKNIFQNGVGEIPPRTSVSNK